MSNQVQPGFIPRFTVADRLRKARELTGLDRQTFAEEIFVSRDTVSHYESDSYTRKRQDSTLRLWSLRTGVPFEWLRDGAAPTTEGPGPGLSQDRGRGLPRLDSDQQPSDYRPLAFAA